MERKKCSPLAPSNCRPRRFFERLADGVQLPAGSDRFHARPGVPGVAGQEPGHVFRVGQRGGVEHDALEVVEEAVAVGRHQASGWRAASQKSFSEAARRYGSPFTGRSASSCTDEEEVAVVGDEHLAVLVPVAGRPVRCRPSARRRP